MARKSKEDTEMEVSSEELEEVKEEVEKMSQPKAEVVDVKELLPEVPVAEDVQEEVKEEPVVKKTMGSQTGRKLSQTLSEKPARIRKYYPKKTKR